jgi:L-fuconolactonase
MRIDAHQHFWQFDRFPYPWMPPDPSVLRRHYLPSDLRSILDTHRFDGSIAVQAASVPGEVQWLLELASEHPSILGVVGWVDLTSPSLPAELDTLQKHPRFKGVRHPVHDEPDEFWLLRDDVIEGLKELARRDLPYDLLLRPRHLMIVPQLADRVPGLRMVIDHLAKPPIATGNMQSWSQDMERSAQIPEIYVKVSGMITEADHQNWKSDQLRPFVECVFRLFGPDRLMFGSDWPVCLLAGSWKEVLAAFTQACGPLAVEVREKLLGGTAAKFYGIIS